MNNMAGAGIVRGNFVLTAIFIITASIATIVFESPWKNIAAAVAIGCFALGVVVFLWGYWTAVQRSRQDNIAVAALYFLVDNCAPRRIAVVMNALLGVQVVTGIVTASIRSSTDGSPGSTLAFGILVPMLGLGLNGLWGAMYGTFRPRIARGNAGVSDEAEQKGQDSSHD